MAFGIALKRMREARNLSQKAIGELCGTTGNTIARIERGEQEPGWSTVQKLAAALGVDCTAFADDPADTATTSTSTASGDTQPEPEATPTPKRGRPKKAKAEGEGQPPVEKKPVGRPKKVGEVKGPSDGERDS